MNVDAKVVAIRVQKHKQRLSNSRVVEIDHGDFLVFLIIIYP